MFICIHSTYSKHKTTDERMNESPVIDLLVGHT